MVGSHVGKYRIIDRIGRGGMGTVYKALDETLHRDVAIKVLNAELNDPEVAKRFRAEAITVARLSHPGITSIYELFEHEGQWLMVMEFVRGETLENMVARMGPLSAQRGAELCMQTLSALAHAHSMGVVHRDLKPANIMITENGSVKVMDFGIARVSGSEHLTNAGFMMGTPAYMAPEQVRGGEVDARADLYAMGVVFYRLTTSKLPFKGDTAFSMVQSQVNDPPTPVHTIRPELPSWVDDVVSRALAKNAEQRFQSAAEFHEAFARCLAGLTLSSMYHASGDSFMTPSRPMPTGSFSRPTPSTPYPAMSGSYPTVMSPGTNSGMISASDDPTVLTPVASQAFPVDTRTPWNQTGAGTAATAAPTTANIPKPPPARKSNTGMWIGLVGLGIIVASLATFLVTKGPGSSGSSGSSSSTGTAGTPTPLPTDPATTQTAQSSTGQQAAPTLTPAPTTTPPVTSTTSVGPAATPTVTPGARATAPGTTPAPGAAVTGARGATTVAGPVTTATPTPTPSTTPAPVAGRATGPGDETLATFPNVKIYIVNGKNGTDRDVLLNFIGGQVLVVPRNGGAPIAAIPYRKILRATYTLARDPKWDASLPGPPAGFDVGSFMRTTRHWLVVQGSDALAVLRLEDNNFKQILETFEARTGIKIAR